MSDNDWLDCDKERNVLRGRVVELEGRIDHAVKLLDEIAPWAGSEKLDQAVTILEGMEEL